MIVSALFKNRVGRNSCIPIPHNFSTIALSISISNFMKILILKLTTFARTIYVFKDHEIKSLSVHGFHVHGDVESTVWEWDMA